VILQSDQHLHPTGMEYYLTTQIGRRTRTVKVCVERERRNGRWIRLVKTIMLAKALGTGAQLWP